MPMIVHFPAHEMAKACIEVVEGQFLKTNGKEHCFVAPVKLPRSDILSNIVNKIITAIKKILEIALVAAKPTRKWRHTVKIGL